MRKRERRDCTSRTKTNASDTNKRSSCRKGEEEELRAKERRKEEKGCDDEDESKRAHKRSCGGGLRVGEREGTHIRDDFVFNNWIVWCTFNRVQVGFPNQPLSNWKPLRGFTIAAAVCCPRLEPCEIPSSWAWHAGRGTSHFPVLLSPISSCRGFRPNVICAKGVGASPSFQLIKIDNGNSYGWAKDGTLESDRPSALAEARMNVKAI